MKCLADADAAQYMEDNYIAYFTLGRGMPGFECRQLSAGTFYADSGWSDSFFNVVVKSDVTTAALLGEAEAVLARFLSAGRPFRWKVSKKQHQLRRFLEEKGLTLAEENYIFSSQERWSPSKISGAGRLICHEASNASKKRLWWIPFQSAFNVCPTLKDSICDFNEQASEKRPGLFKNLVFTLKNVPVCSATLFEHNGSHYLYDLGVHVDYQRQGIAKHAMALLNRIIYENGHKHLIFYSTPIGRSLYQRLGFHEHGTVDIYGAPNALP